MKRILEEKKKYNEIEIPSELGERVALAIEQSKVKKKKGLAFYVKVLAAPVAVCAAIGIAIGISGIGEGSPIENDEEIAMVSDTTATAEMAKSARMTPMNDVYHATAGTERMNEEVTKNNSSVIYSGETYISISRVDEQGKVRYLNFTQVDAENVSLEMLGIEGYDGETPFYVNSDDTVVVIVDGVEKEIEIKRK
ncbi:MAG: hypothetical protein IKM21_04805 [Oscillospiraceae bacterium]|nr:hypothetical protein [Oscillospiraceae bacterium]